MGKGVTLLQYAHVFPNLKVLFPKTGQSALPEAPGLQISLWCVSLRQCFNPFSPTNSHNPLPLKWSRFISVRKRSTKAELEFRISTIYGLLCDGKSNTQIFRFIAEDTGWGVSERQMENYIAEARKRLAQDCQISREAFMAEALAGYRSLREQAERRGQLMCAKQCLDAQIALVGLGK